jgi:hypothetical protein
LSAAAEQQWHDDPARQSSNLRPSHQEHHRSERCQHPTAASRPTSELSKACQRWQTCDQGVDRRQLKTSHPRKIRRTGSATAGLARLIGAAAATWPWRSWFARLLADLCRIGGAAKALKHALVSKLTGDDRMRNELLEVEKRRVAA